MFNVLFMMNEIIRIIRFYFTLFLEVIRYSYEKATRRDYLNYSTRSIDGKIVIVTGANTGIGKSTVFEFVSRGATVILACRNLAFGEKAIKDIRMKTQNGKMDLMQLDLADLNSVEHFCLNVRNKYSVIDILVNNAGVYDTSGAYKTTKDGHELHFGTNYLGHFVLTDLLLDLLRKSSGSRIISVASSTQLFAVPHYNLNNLMLKKSKSLGLFNSLGYAMSKYYISLHARQLQERLRPHGIRCYSVCPGFVDTEIFRNFEWYEKLASELAVLIFGITPEEGCQNILYLALCDDDSTEPGKFYRFNRLHSTINSEINLPRSEELWKATEVIVKQRKFNNNILSLSVT